MLVLKIVPELNDDTKHGLFALIGYSFCQQEEIIKIVEFYIGTKMTSLEKGKQIIHDVQSIIQNKLNYNPVTGLLFKDAFLS